MGEPLSVATAQSMKYWFRKATEAYEPSTVILYSTTLRTIYQHAHSESRTKALFNCIPIKDLRREVRRKLAYKDQLVAGTEFEALMRVAVSPRVKAFLAVLYDSGARKGEIVSLRIRDVSLGEKYTTIMVKGKTGERTIPLVKLVPYLRAWLQVHPDRNPESPLFVTVMNGKVKPMSERSVNCTLKRLCERAKIRYLNPHMLRHTRLTELAKLGLGEYQLKNFAGWTADSRMSARYLHLTGRAHINAVLEAEGIEVEKEGSKEPDFFKMNICPNCGGSIGIGQIFCSNCGLLLDERLQIGRVDEMRTLRDEVKTLRELLDESRNLTLLFASRKSST